MYSLRNKYFHSLADFKVLVSSQVHMIFITFQFRPILALLRQETVQTSKPILTLFGTFQGALSNQVNAIFRKLKLIFIISFQFWLVLDILEPVIIQLDLRFLAEVFGYISYVSILFHGVNCRTISLAAMYSEKSV